MFFLLLGKTHPDEKYRLIGLVVHGCAGWYSDGPMKKRPLIAPIKFLFFSLLLTQGLVGCSPKPEQAKGTFEDAQKFYDQGKTGEAEKILTALKIQKPADAKVHFLLGRIYRETKRPDQAIEELEGVVNLDSQNAVAQATLARLYQSKGMFDQALASALAAKKLDPGSGGVYNILGTVYFDKGDYEEAVRNYEQALAYEADSAWVYNNLGLVYIQMKKWPEAKTQLEKALKADPENAVAHNNLGVVLVQEKEYEKALREFETAHSLDSGYQKASQNITDTQKIIDRSKKPKPKK